MIRDIFDELIEEACKGKVLIDGEEWPIGFDTIIFTDNKDISYRNDRNLSCLVIKNEDEFLNLLEKYVDMELSFGRKIPSFISDKKKNTIKWIISYLFVNATTEDFINPCEYIKRRINFLDDYTFSYLDDGRDVEINNQFLGSKLRIERNIHSIAMETVYRIDISLINKIRECDVSYPLATVSYGISEEDGEKVCYIYSLMKPKKNTKDNTEENDFYEKKISRLMYKINEGISNYEMGEYYDYKEGNSKYYPEGNITDVTPSFVLSLNIFISLLQKEGIHKIKAVPYLPVRYLSREIAASYVKDEDRRFELKKRNEMIQENITNKFIRTFRRLEFHDQDIKITAIPYEGSEYLEMNVKDKEHMLNNPILEDISMSTYHINDSLDKGYR